MQRSIPIPKSLLAAMAAIFGAAVILYSGLWMYSIRWQSGVELGIDFVYLRSQHCELVRSVESGSPAARAGLKPGDRIVGINGHEVEDPHLLYDVWSRQKPGNTVKLSVQRPNASSPTIVTAVFRARHKSTKEAGLTERLGQEILNTYPLVFLIVGLPVLFLRLEDRNAWLLALMFACFTAAPPFPNLFAGLDPPLRSFATSYRAICDTLLGAVFYCFFALFPTRSWLDRHAPWLKWAGLVIGISFALPGLRLGFSRAPAPLERLVGGHFSNRIILSFYNYGFIALGLTALIGNAASTPDPETRRKIRVILWGTIVGVVPIALQTALGDFFHIHPPFLLGLTLLLLLFLFPLSFAYAVVKHRVLEVPALLRRGVRYLLVLRGFTVLLTLASAVVILVFAGILSPYMELPSAGGVPGGIVAGACLGTILLLAGMRVHKHVAEKIDRAFFRSAYDARMVLEGLVEISRTATDRARLADLLQHHLERALRPSSLVVYLETANRQISAMRGNVPTDLETLPLSDPLIQEVAHRGRPWEVPNEEESLTKTFLLAPIRPDCLVPVMGRDSRLVGLLVLGERLSEEPYSREDKQLLASVATQAGIALESILLGEQIAERIEAERRAAQEMEFARQVQSRLFPQKLPILRTLEYAGGCAPAREVGGDYYDFLELQPGRVALVLADIAGKGVSGALLMANLQANLRSQYALALNDIGQLLSSVNRLFFENTGDSSYATLFFADYDDSTHRLRYVNCGHLPPLLLRSGKLSETKAGSQPVIDRLEPTSTVVGLFENWECHVAETQLNPGDTLLLYTDGVTEATGPEGNEFGESCLIRTLCAHNNLEPRPLLDSVIEAVQEFSHGDQADDITLVVARCTA